MHAIKPAHETRLIEKVLGRVREDRLVTENLVFFIWLAMVKGFLPKLRFIFLSLFRHF
jgi:hypothetical protein